MDFLSKSTLQKTTSILVLTVFAVGLGLFSWLAIRAVNDSVNNTLAERLTIARMLAKQLDKNLAYSNTFLIEAADFEGRAPDTAQFWTRSETMRSRMSEYGFSVEHILFVDKDNQIIQADLKDITASDSDIYNFSNIIKTLTIGTVTISTLVTDPFFGTPVVFFSTPVVSDKGEILGGLITSINMEKSEISPVGQDILPGDTGYMEIVDVEGLVLARTEPGVKSGIYGISDHAERFSGLIRQGKATVRTCHRCHDTSAGTERRRDVLAFAPLTKASWGIAIRQSEEEALAPARNLEKELILLGIVVMVSAFTLTWLLSKRIVSPIKNLTAAAKRVAAGDFGTRINIKRQDEIGQLATAFSTMTQDLARSRDELVLRNEELSAINAIVATANQSLDLEDVLTSTLEKVLAMTRAQTGCVFLRDHDSDRLELRSCINSTHIFNCSAAGDNEARCACHRVLLEGQILMVNDVSQCPILDKMGPLNSFVCIPLKSKDKTLGLINIASAQDGYFSSDDFKLLDSIGYHIGLAIENSALYENARQKEKLKDQLLNKVITAQEEERKRIARELHDEYGQTLTATIISIESLEAALPGTSALRKKLAHSKSILTRALDDIRKLTLDLRPASLDDLGLVSVTREYIETRLKPEGLKVQFVTKGLSHRLSTVIETTVFRIIQEACHNVVKHAEAGQIKITLEIHDRNIRAKVEDDGKGFDLNSVFKYKVGVKSMGLLGIQERINLIGGKFDIKTGINEGTVLTVEVPLDKEGM